MTLPVEAPPGAAHNPVWEPGLDGLWIPGGTFRMGSDRHYPEEAPVHRVRVDGFWMDRTPVTNRQFRAFVEATGYATLAEHPSDPKGKSGSLVFTPPKRPVDLRDWTQWWEFRVGANWRHPYGPSSSIDGQDDHPVVHVAYRDAEAFALWAGKTLPTEAEWEFAARGGLDGADFAWGNDFLPGGRYMANTWQGAFPHQNLRHDGYERTSPVTAFPANGYGLYDMTERVGMDHGLVHQQAHGRGDGRAGSGQLRPAPAPDPDSTQGPERRLAPLRAKFLPALSARRPARTAGRHAGGPPGLSLHRAQDMRQSVSEPRVTAGS